MQVTPTSLELVCIFFKMIFVQDDFYSKTGSYLNEKKETRITQPSRICIIRAVRCNPRL